MLIRLAVPLVFVYNLVGETGKKKISPGFAGSKALMCSLEVGSVGYSASQWWKSIVSKHMARTSVIGEAAQRSGKMPLDYIEHMSV